MSDSMTDTQRAELSAIFIQGLIAGRLSGLEGFDVEIEQTYDETGLYRPYFDIKLSKNSPWVRVSVSPRTQS